MRVQAEITAGVNRVSRRPKYTMDEFATDYARESGVTIAWLQRHGREAEVCDCAYSGCRGWQMGYR